MKECRLYSEWCRYIDLAEAEGKDVEEFYRECSQEETAVIIRPLGVFVVFVEQDGRGMKKWSRSLPLVFGLNGYRQPNTDEWSLHMLREDGIIVKDFAAVEAAKEAALAAEAAREDGIIVKDFAAVEAVLAAKAAREELA